MTLALIAGVGMTPPAAQAVISNTPNDCGNVPVDMMADCPTGPVPPTPSPAPQPTGQPSTTDERTRAAKSADQGTQFGQDEEPTGWAGPIAKDLGQGTQGLAEDLSERLAKDGLLPDFKFSQGYLTLYAIMFGLGQVIAAAATMIATVKLAERGVESRLLFRQAMIRLLTFTPVAALTPLLVAYASQLGEGLAQGFLSMAADQLRAQLEWLVKALAVGTLAALVVPGGSAVMVGVFLFLIASLVGVLLELAISHYLVFLLALLVPILYAASINPKWRGGVTKVTGGLLGALLAPAALFLVWVVAFSAVPPAGSDNFFMRAGMLIVGLLLSLAAPLAVGMVLSYVVPAFTGGRYDGATLSGLAERAASKVTSGGRPQGPRSSRSQRASDANDHSNPGPPVETPSKGGLGGAVAPGGAPSITAGAGGGPAAITAGGGAAGGPAAGAGAVAGPVGAAAGLWVGMVNKVRSGAVKVRDTVSNRTASGGDQANRGGSEPADEPSTNGGTADRPKPSDRQAETPVTSRNAGEAPDTNRDAGDTSGNAGAAPGGKVSDTGRNAGAAPGGKVSDTGRNAGEKPDVSRNGDKTPATSRAGGEKPDAAGPVRAGGRSSSGVPGGRDVEPTTTGRGGSQLDGGGLGPTGSGPGFTPAPGVDRPRRSRSDDGGDV